MRKFQESFHLLWLSFIYGMRKKQTINYYLYLILHVFFLFNIQEVLNVIQSNKNSLRYTKDAPIYSCRSDRDSGSTEKHLCTVSFQLQNTLFIFHVATVTDEPEPACSTRKNMRATSSQWLMFEQFIFHQLEQTKIGSQQIKAIQ